MRAVAYIESYERLRDEPLWRLLAALNGPVILGILQSHLFQDERRIPASLLFHRVEEDLEELRAAGAELPQSAQIYIANWLSQGYLERHFPAGAVEEEYELSSASDGAIRFVNSLKQKRFTATESRLSVVIQQLELLAEETDANPKTRLARLISEREKIDQDISDIKKGKIKTLDERKALERTREIINLAEGLIGDFASVRAEFDNLNANLRKTIVDESDSRGEVLEQLFSGVDLITESPAGRSFSAFWSLLTDPERCSSFEFAIEQVLSRNFSKRLSGPEKKFLLHVTDILLREGGVVNEGLKNFAKSLRRFVQSREYLEQKRLNTLLRQAQAASLDIKDHIKQSDINYTLVLTTSKFSSISQLRLHDPSSAKLDGSVTISESSSVDLMSVSAMVADSEIDFTTLKKHIRETLLHRSEASIGEVLELFPAKQGLGSVVGLISLGSRFGVRVDYDEHISWITKDERIRKAKIPAIFFSRECLNELG